MKTSLTALFVIAFTLFPAVTSAQTEAGGAESGEKNRTTIYLIGNSLTWDTIPSKLDGDVQWHVDCGKSLKYIFEHPEEPCVKSSILWPEALKSKQYDIVSVQPHYGTTLNDDVEAISKWVEMQPQAVFVVHTGWARSATLAEEFASTKADGKLSHSSAYYSAILKRLKSKHPQTTFRTTHAMRLLAELQQKISVGDSELSSIENIYRDAIHMTLTGGRYMMHNAMRETLGQPRVANGFGEIPPALKMQLDQLLDVRRAWPDAGLHLPTTLK